MLKLLMLMYVDPYVNNCTFKKWITEGAHPSEDQMTLINFFQRGVFKTFSDIQYRAIWKNN